jgi:hypothetical protein
MDYLATLDMAQLNVVLQNHWTDSPILFDYRVIKLLEEVRANKMYYNMKP